MCGAFQLKDERAIASMIGVALLAAWALWLGYDGVIYMTAIAVIAGLGGYVLMKESPAGFRGIADAIELFDRKRDRE